MKIQCPGWTTFFCITGQRCLWSITPQFRLLPLLLVAHQNHREEGITENTMHAFIAEHEWTKLGLSWKLFPCWLAFYCWKYIGCLGRTATNIPAWLWTLRDATNTSGKTAHWYNRSRTEIGETSSCPLRLQGPWVQIWYTLLLSYTCVLCTSNCLLNVCVWSHS